MSGHHNLHGWVMNMHIGSSVDWNDITELQQIHNKELQLNWSTPTQVYTRTLYVELWGTVI